jgi:hypothetical protein
MLANKLFLIKLIQETKRAYFIRVLAPGLGPEIKGVKMKMRREEIICKVGLETD